MRANSIIAIILVSITSIVVSLSGNIVATLITQNTDWQEYLWFSWTIFGVFSVIAIVFTIWQSRTKSSNTTITSTTSSEGYVREMRWTFFLEWICLPWLITMFFSCIQTSFIFAYKPINEAIMNNYGFNIIIIYIMSSLIRFIVLRSYGISGSWFVYTTLCIYCLLAITYVNIHNLFGILIVFVFSLIYVLIETFIFPFVIQAEYSRYHS